jgi:hypothetical protein
MGKPLVEILDAGLLDLLAPAGLPLPLHALFCFALRSLVPEALISQIFGRALEEKDRRDREAAGEPWEDEFTDVEMAERLSSFFARVATELQAGSATTSSSSVEVNCLTQPRDLEQSSAGLRALEGA